MFFFSFLAYLGSVGDDDSLLSPVVSVSAGFFFSSELASAWAYDRRGTGGGAGLVTLRGRGFFPEEGEELEETAPESPPAVIFDSELSAGGLGDLVKSIS